MKKTKIPTIAYKCNDLFGASSIFALIMKLKKHGSVILTFPNMKKVKKVGREIFFKCDCDLAWDWNDGNGQCHRFKAHDFKNYDLDAANASIRMKLVKNGILLTRKKLNKPEKVILSEWRMGDHLVFRVASSANIIAIANDITNPDVEPIIKIHLTYAEFLPKADGGFTTRKHTNTLATIENGNICRNGVPLGLTNNDDVIEGLHNGASK